jgi:hypothetical protein
LEPVTGHIKGWRARRDAPGPQILTDPIDAESIGTGLVNGFEVLAKLDALPVATWRYRWESADVRHLGPMAQDWHAAFGLGKGDTTIPMVDAHGVLVVAVQALHRQVGELRAELDQLHQQLADRSPHR